MPGKIHVLLVHGEQAKQRALRENGYLEGMEEKTDKIKELGGFTSVVETMLAERLYKPEENETTKKDPSLRLYSRGYQTILVKTRFYEDGILEEAIFIASDEQAVGDSRELARHLERIGECSTLFVFA